MSQAEFIDLCKQLRALGVVKVAHGAFSAEFVPVTAAYAVPSTGQRRQEERPPTLEEANEARRRRELGRD